MPMMAITTSSSTSVKACLGCLITDSPPVSGVWIDAQSRRYGPGGREDLERRKQGSANRPAGSGRRAASTAGGGAAWRRYRRRNSPADGCGGALRDQARTHPIELVTGRASIRQGRGQDRPKLCQALTLPCGRDTDKANSPAFRATTCRGRDGERRGSLPRVAARSILPAVLRQAGLTDEGVRIDVLLRRPGQLFGVRKATAMLLAAGGVMATARAIHARE